MSLVEDATVGAHDAVTVVNPTADRFGEGAYTLAPRLESLEGATLGLLWNAKANGDVALRRAGDLLKAQIPGLKINFYSGTMLCSPALLQQAADECDAVVACTADCGSCTSWITHDCVQLERAGVPTAIIASAGFEHDIVASAQAFAMPTQHFVVVPRVYNNLSQQEAIDQTDPVVADIVPLLTRGHAMAPRGDEYAWPSVAAEEDFTASNGASAFEVFNEAFHDRNWTDGYMVYPPTAQRVERLLAGVDGRADDVVCILPPGNGEATVAKVAVNAAMAGCEPADMPVLMAILRALAHKENQGALRICLMSTGAHAPLVLVNGPIAKELGINGGRCCLGPGRQNSVNTRISRAFHLCLRNIGRWVPGVMDLDTIGTARKNIVVLAENDDESPWEPYHVSKGFSADESTVTLFFTAGEWDISLQGHVDGDQLAQAIASMGVGNSTGYSLGTFGQDYTSVPLGRLLLVPPPHAIPVSEAGYSKQEFEHLLWETGTAPISRLIEPMRKLHADGKTRREFDWMFELSDDEARTRSMPVIEKPELYSVVVAGSVRAKDLLMPLRTLPETEVITATPQGVERSATN